MDNDAAKRGDSACIEWIDREIPSLLAASRRRRDPRLPDHGDCWVEDGLREHGIHHRRGAGGPAASSARIVMRIRFGYRQPLRNIVRCNGMLVVLGMHRSGTIGAVRRLAKPVPSGYN
jgi:hypothetical protein